MALGDAAIQNSLPGALAAIVEGVVRSEALRDRCAVDNTIRLLRALDELAGPVGDGQAVVPPEAVAQKIAEVGVPRFYQTALLRIVVQMAISARRDTETAADLGVEVSVATIDARYAARYSAATAAASTVEIEMVPSPAPDYLMPLLDRISAHLPSPPQQPEQPA
ncbi:MAG: hypothetical protein ACE5O2_16860 [Armatimonadota bacterium]